MAVTMVVEDGTGLSTANSYVSVSDADTLLAMRGYALEWDQAATAGTPPAGSKEQMLMWATRLLDEQCAWLGERMSTSQALRWPRSSVPTKDDDDYLANNVIPQFLKVATAELALALLKKDRPEKSEDQRETGRTSANKSVTLGPKDGRWMAIIPPHVLGTITPYIRSHSIADLVRTS